MPSPDHLSAASSLLPSLFFLLISSSAAAGDATTTAGPLLRHPTLALPQARGVPDETKAQALDSAIGLPLPRATERSAFWSQAKAGAAAGGWCSYTVTIKTSCSSPRITRDAVSLDFGDVYGHEVYAARLDDPASGTFERCSVDSFRIAGPCGGRTCYLYLRRYGRDGWTPEYVKVFYSPGDPRAAVTFFYKVPIPYGVWYGFNLCHGATIAVPAPLDEAAAEGLGGAATTRAT